MSQTEKFDASQFLPVWIYLASTGLILMEACLSYLYYRLIFPWDTSSPALFLILILIPIGTYFTVRLFRIWKVKPAIQKIVFIIGTFFIISASLMLTAYKNEETLIFFAIIKTFINLFANSGEVFDFLHMIWILLVMMRAVWLSGEPIDSAVILNSFKIGFIVLLIYGFFIANNQNETSIFAIILFFFISLISISSSRIADLHNLKGGRLPPFSMRWLLTILLIAVSILLIGVTSSWLLGNQFSKLITTLLFLAIEAILLAAIVVSIPFFLIINFIIQWIGSFISNSNLPMEEASDVVENPLTTAILEEVENLDTLLNASGYAQIILYFAIFIALIVIIIFLLRRKPWQPSVTSLEEDYSAVSPGNRKRGNILPKWLTNLRSKSIKTWYYETQIRKYYSLFLRKCEELDIQRSHAQTPLEFSNTVIQVLPDLQTEIKLITKYYIRSRYGQYPETKDEIDEMKTSWEKIDRQAANQRKERKP